MRCWRVSVSEGRRFHDLARGLDAGPPVLVTPPPDLVEQVELDPPVARVDAVAFAAKGLAGRLLVRLAERGLACTRVVIEAETEHGERLARCWRHDHVLTPAALAERVRWQLDGWLAGHRRFATCRRRYRSSTTGGLTLLRLVPDEVVPADGRQLGFWGGDQAAHDRADRALARVQGLLGYEAVATAVVQGGRTPAEQVRWVPWGEAREPQRPLVVDTFPTAWPGALPSPFPARVLDPPAPAQLCDEHGRAVVVSGRGEQSAAPARVECALLPGGGGDVSGLGRTVGLRRALVGSVARRRCALAGGRRLRRRRGRRRVHRHRRRRIGRHRSDLRLKTHDGGARSYAELHCHSNFSFLDGASHPEELAEEAARLGLAALAITDHDGFYGVVRFAEAARAVDLPTVFGAELTLGAKQLPNGIPDPAGEHLIVLAQGPVGYARLAKAISEAQLAGEKGAPRTSLAQLADAARAPVHLAGNVAARENDHWFVLTGCRKGSVPAALQRDGPAAAQKALAASWSTRSVATACSSSCGITAIRSTGTATTRSPRSRCRPAWKWSRPTTCTTPRPRAVRWRPRSPRCVPAVRSTRSTVGCRRDRSRTCAARASSSAGSRAGPARSSARSRSRVRARST